MSNIYKTYKRTSKRERKFREHRIGLKREHPSWLDKYDWQ